MEYDPEWTAEQRTLFEGFLKEHPEFENLTVEEGFAWLQAMKEDTLRIIVEAWRHQGVMPAEDLKLFLDVWRTCPGSPTFADMIAALREKKRRGHKQQQALDIYEAHYKGRNTLLEEPDEATMARIEAEIDARLKDRK